MSNVEVEKTEAKVASARRAFDAAAKALEDAQRGAQQALAATSAEARSKAAG